MKIIVGLGNPGPEYYKSRHNFGYQVADELSRRWNEGFRGSRFDADVLLNLGDKKILVVKPTSFMNLSGEVVAKILSYYKRTIRDLLVVYDDLDLPLGRMKWSPAGGSAGHRGIDSIIEALNSKDFARLRLGIGKSPVGQAGADYVLQSFLPMERPVVEQVIHHAADAVEFFLENPLEAVANRFNSVTVEGEKK